MAVKAYFDGSGKTNDPACKVATLASIGIEEALVPEFEALWLENVLEKHGIKELHMTDLMARRGEFEGWTEDRMRRCFFQAVRVLNKIPIDDLRGIACSVVLEDHQRCLRKHPKLKSAAAILVDFCVSHVGVGEDEKIDLHFDRNEEFMHKINRVWERLRKSKEGWPSQVKSIKQASSDKTYPLQAVDVLAWVARQRALEAMHGMHGMHVAMVLATRYPHRSYNTNKFEEAISKGRLLKP